MVSNLVILEQTPNPEILTEPALKVALPLSTQDLEQIQKMKKLLIQLNGVGLAAPQIGIRKQIVIINISEDAKAIRKDAKETISLFVLINPQYEKMPDAKTVYDWEGCFSVSETTGKVPRFDKIIYRGYNEFGEFIESSASGFTARVLQHEIDHVQGILIVDRLTKDSVQGHPDQMLKVRYQEMDERQKEIFEKIVAKRNENTGQKDSH